MIRWGNGKGPTMQGTQFVGMDCDAADLENFWQVPCPCQQLATYPINGFPTVDTPHPCGHPDHWVIKVSK